MATETSEEVAAEQKQEEIVPEKEDDKAEPTTNLTNGKDSEVNITNNMETAEIINPLESTEACESTKVIESSEENTNKPEEVLKENLEKDESIKDCEPSSEKDKVADDGSGDQQIDLDKLITRQLEYYFGNINLNYDTFLEQAIAKNAEGWVPLELLMKFKRLASICNSQERVIEALSKTPSSVVQLDKENKMVRRHPENPVPVIDPNGRMEIRKRTAYAKGFPLDSDLNVLVDYFTEFEGFEHVDMRKYYDRSTTSWKFKGSVYAIFRTVEQCEKFIEMPSVR